MSSAPIQSTSMNRSNPSQSNYKSSLPPKHPSRGDVGGSGGGGHGRRNVQEMDQGDSLDRMMKKSSNAIPGLESHYSKNDSRASQKPMGRNEYAEELRRQIEKKKEIDSELDQRGPRRSYSYDSNSTNSLSLGQSGGRGRHGGPQQSLHPDDYAESLRSQIAQKSHLKGREAAEAYNPREQIKAYSAPEPTRTGRRIVPAGGHSTFSLKWEG
jgi:hypothetical protein